MTRPGYVLVEFPIEEAEGLLEICEESASINARLPVRTQRFNPRAAAGRERLERAVKVERGPSGSAEEPPIEPVLGEAA